MNPISRRIFMSRTAATAVGIGLNPSGLMTRAAEAALPSGKSVLVHLFLRGGADGLSMVPPYGDPLLYSMRSTVAQPRPGKDGGVTALDDYFGLHPGLAPLKRAYVDKRLAVVHAVGNHDVSRSHFSAQDFVELGTPGIATTPGGTLDRLVGTLDGDSPVKAISFSKRTPVSFQGPENPLVSLELATFRLRAKSWQAEAEERVKAMYEGTPLHNVAKEIFEVIQVLNSTSGAAAIPANGAAYPDSFLGNALRQAAQIVKSKVGTRCIFIGGEGNFDTHAGQVPSNAADFASLGSSLAAFDTDLGAQMDDVALIVTTEFGRTAFENGSHGTDHGSGFCSLVLGGKVRGGRVYGRWPGLEKDKLFEERDLEITTDFRDLFAEVTRGQLGPQADAGLFPGFKPGLGLGLFA